MDNINAAIQRPTLLDDYKSQSLYSLTQWSGTFFNYWKSNIGTNDQWVLSWYGNVETRELKTRIPAYDVGFLLDKIPKSVTLGDEEYLLTIDAGDDNWLLFYKSEDGSVYREQFAENLVDGLAEMITKLFEDELMNNQQVS